MEAVEFFLSVYMSSIGTRGKLHNAPSQIITKTPPQVRWGDVGRRGAPGLQGPLPAPPSPQEELSWDPRHNDIGVMEPPGSGPSHLLEGPEGSPSPLEGEPRRLLELKN